MRFYRDWITDVPDELTTVVVHRKAPPLPVVPVELHGEPVVTVICCYAGSVEEGEKVVAPLKAFGSPVLDLCTPKPFINHQSMFDPSFLKGWWYYFRSCDVAELTDEVIDITADLRDQEQLLVYPSLVVRQGLGGESAVAPLTELSAPEGSAAGPGEVECLG